MFKVKNFHNILKDTSIPEILLIQASSHGENYLFAKKNNATYFSVMEITKIYEHAEKKHIHNTIILGHSNMLSNSALDIIKKYNIQIWDQNKINSLIYSPATSNILHTSDTSDDTCKIDKNEFNPIQEPKSFLENIFKKPNRL